MPGSVTIAESGVLVDQSPGITSKETQKEQPEPDGPSAKAKPAKEEVGWRRIVRNFTPS